MLHTTFLHSGWEFAEKNWPGGKVATVSTGWLPAQVPGHVHLDLVQSGIIADPFVRMNELGCQWVDETDWSYRTSFQWEPKADAPRRVLRFEGLDTVCTVILNGETVAEHDNMFLALEVDVTDKLREGENTLQIDFQSAARVGRARRAEYFASNQISDDVLWFDERSFVRKAQYMFGWDWGPRLVSAGIWRPVSLVEFEARLTDVHVRQEWLEDGTVALHITSETEGPCAVVHQLGDNAWMVGDGTILVQEYDLWEPDDPETFLMTSYAMPKDYEGLASFGTELSDSEDDEVVAAVRAVVLRTDCLDLKQQNIGIVETKLIRQPDEFGESFEFQVNGEKLWARGANWIPDHSFPSIVDKARLRDRLEKAKDMGFNMLRVWGGGLYETDEFYDLCDELGILVWQDFPFACAYYPDDAQWQAVIEREASENLKRLRNHPCLALWCGNNENLEMHVNRWGGERQPSRYFGENHYDKVLPNIVSRLDSGRAYIATSPIGSPPDEKVVDAKRRGPNADGYGDQHNWDAWHGRGDWRYYTDSKGRFSSEYGFASSCSLAVWNDTIAEEDWDPHSPVVQWHDRTGKGHDTFHGFVKLHYPEPVTLEDWVYYSQLNQRDALRCGVEHYRRSPFCAGSLIWQLNDCWPVQSWSILDSDGNYKALAYELRRLYADQLLSIERHNETVRVWAVNHGCEDWLGDITLTAYHLTTGEVLGEWTGEVDEDAGEIALAIEANISGLAVPDTILVASCATCDDTWQLLAEPKQARYAEPLPILVSTHEEGFLTLQLQAPVVDLMLTCDGDPMWFQDNFLTSMGGIVEIACEHVPDVIEARSLSGDHLVKFTRSPL